MGLSAWVLGDKNHTSRELRLAADRFIPLDITTYFGWADKEYRERFPLPGMIHGPYYMRNENYQLVGDGTVGEHQAWLYRKPGSIGIMMESLEDNQPLNIYCGDYERLKLFCELTHGTAIFNVEP